MTLARIGRFQVERMLGTGSFATVWLARDEDLDAWVAIKLLAENWSLNEDARRRFMEEAKALRQLDHDRIVRVYEVGRLPDDRPYMVMEYADRGSLEERMRLRAQLDQPFSVAEAITLAVDIAECLASVHDLRIVHRDVKPSNILFRSLGRERQEALEREGRPRATERTLLGDFGIARRLEGARGATKVVGSPQYMAPEQADPARARLVDQRGDVYSAAVVLYELLTGRVPDAGAGQSHAGPPIQELRPDVPPALAQAMDRALSHDPDDRFPTSWEWRSALVEALEGAREGAGAMTPPAAASTAPAPAAATATSPLPGGAASGSTSPVETRKQTAILPGSQPAGTAVGLTGEGPGVATRPEPAPAGMAPPGLGVRVYAAAMVAGAAGLLVAIFLPVSSQRNLSGVSVDAGGLSFTAAALVAGCGLVLLLAGVLLWRARRRWAGRGWSVLALLAGLVAMAVAGWAAVDVLLGGGGASPRPGLFVIAVAGGIAALAGSATSRRLRPPLATVPTTGR